MLRALQDAFDSNPMALPMAGSFTVVILMPLPASPLWPYMVFGLIGNEFWRAATDGGGELQQDSVRCIGRVLRQP